MFVFGASNIVDEFSQSSEIVERSCQEHEWYKHPFFKLSDPNLKINAEKTKYVFMDKVVFDIDSVAETTETYDVLPSQEFLDVKKLQEYTEKTNIDKKFSKDYVVNFKSEFDAFKNDFAEIGGLEKNAVLFQTWDHYYDAYCKFNVYLVQFYLQKHVEYGNEQTLCWYLVYNREKYETWKGLEKFIAFIFPSPWFWGFGDEMVLFESTAKYIYEQDSERFCVTLRCMIYNFGMFLIDCFGQIKKGFKVDEMDEETKNKTFDSIINTIKIYEEDKIEGIDDRKENIINGVACAISSLRYFGEIELANSFYMFFTEKIKSQIVQTEEQEGLIDFAYKFKTVAFINDLNSSMKLKEKEQVKDD